MVSAVHNADTESQRLLGRVYRRTPRRTKGWVFTLNDSECRASCEAGEARGTADTFGGKCVGKSLAGCSEVVGTDDSLHPMGRFRCETARQSLYIYAVDEFIQGWHWHHPIGSFCGETVRQSLYTLQAMNSSNVGISEQSMNSFTVSAENEADKESQRPWDECIAAHRGEPRNGSSHSTTANAEPPAMVVLLVTTQCAHHRWV